jgi:hypothetical protein
MMRCPTKTKSVFFATLLTLPILVFPVSAYQDKDWHNEIELLKQRVERNSQSGAIKRSAEDEAFFTQKVDKLLRQLDTLGQFMGWKMAEEEREKAEEVFLMSQDALFPRSLFSAHEK